MTDSTADIERRIIEACDTIRRVWPVMHQPPTGSIAGKPTPKALYTRPDTDNTDEDIPRLDGVVFLRTETAAAVQRCCRLVVRVQRLTRAVPASYDLPAMTEFLTRWARAMSGHELGPTMAEELQGFAHRCQTVAYPRRRDTLRIGSCPNTVGVNGTAQTCGADVRVKADRPGAVRCPNCGLEDTIDGWLIRMVGTQGPYTASQLVPILHRRLGRVVSESGIRKWVQRGIIEPVKDQWAPIVDGNGQHVYDLEDVLRRLLAHEERKSGVSLHK